MHTKSIKKKLCISLFVCAICTTYFSLNPLTSCSNFKNKYLVKLSVVGTTKNITLSNYEYTIGKQFRSAVLNRSEDDNLDIEITVGKNKLIKNVDFNFDDVTDLLTINEGKLNDSNVNIQIKVSKQAVVPLNLLEIDSTTKELKGFKTGASLNQYDTLNIPDYVVKIGKYAFANVLSSKNSSITKVNFNNDLEIIDDYAFFQCDNLKCKLILPPKLLTINNHAFEGCSNLTGNLNFPESLQEIGDSAFFQCSSLTGNLFFPEKLISLGNHAFSKTNFDGELRLPEKLEHLGQSVFSFCQKLKWNLSLPIALTAVPAGLFAFCTAIEGELVFNKNISSIGDSAFQECKNLRKITLPDELEKIGSNVFRGCSGLTQVMSWGNKLKNIGNYAFNGCDSLSELIFPNTLESIGNNCFENCTNVKTLSLSDNLNYIKDKAFSNCKNIESLNKLPSKLIEIGNEAFAGCEKMNVTTQEKKFVAPGDMIRIGEKAFYNCHNLEMSISFGLIQSAEFFIGESAFENTKINGTTVFSGAILSIPKRCFYNCQYLTDVRLNVQLFAIEESAFEDCRNLSVLFPLETTSNGANLNTIGNNAFKNVKSVYSMNGDIKSETFYIYDSIQSIGDYAFYNANADTSSEITSLTISNGPKSIGKYAFAGWKNLDSLTIEIDDTVVGPPSWLDSDAKTFHSKIFENVYPKEGSTGRVHIIGSPLITEELKKKIYNTLVDPDHCALPKAWQLDI